MKNHKWTSKSREYDHSKKYWACGRCGIGKDKADEHNLNICTNHSYIYDVLIWVKGIRHKLLNRLGHFILRHS